MSTWFSVAAIAPSLSQDWSLTTSEVGLLTVATQLGFVLGALSLAITGVGDLLSTRRVFAWAAVLAAAANVLLPLAAGQIAAALALRFVVGFALAGVYPTGLKLMSTWFQTDRGLAIGALVGALTLGSASPHAAAALGLSTFGWRSVILATSLGALAAALVVVQGVRDGPFETRAPRLDLRWAIDSLRSPALRLANLGYLGHMWELYAMWTWLPLFISASFAEQGVTSATMASALAAGAVGAGAVGSVLAGRAADRFGRTVTTSVAMAVSGTSAVFAGLLFGQNPILVSIVVIVWGVSVVADSGQFSTAITELAPRERVGSALALQTALGFLLTIVSIQILPVIVQARGWSGGFAVLALGPLFGIAAMLRLRTRPESLLLAGGRR